MMKMKYFVLKPKGQDVMARASRAAMLAYADEVNNTDQKLAEDLRNWATYEKMKAADLENRS